MAVVFALCCLACSAVNDFIFKLFADRPMSRGVFFSIIGVIITLTMAPTLNIHSFSGNMANTLIWGCAAGFFSIVGNVLLIEAMGKLSAGICSTIYRLNLIFVVPGAMFFFGETLNPFQLCGVLAAILAIILFSFSTLCGKQKSSLAGMIIIVSAALLRAGMGLAYKKAFLTGVEESSLVFINGLFWVFGGLIYAWLKDGVIKMPGKSTWGFGALSGLFVCGIVFFMAKALQAGAAGVVLSIAQMSFLGTLLLSVIILKEKLEKFKIAGIICGTAAILLLALK
ncbi:MAG: DMT family transporter [Lentisphaeria bacterium]|nr:DMT family transporter [Lentisphaeria bacterium]